MLSMHLSNPYIWPKLDCKKSNGLGVKLFLATAHKIIAWDHLGPSNMKSKSSCLKQWHNHYFVHHSRNISEENKAIS